MSYRDKNGRFISKEKTANDAIATQNGDNYKISDNYQGNKDNAKGTLIVDNPYWKGKFTPKEKTEMPKTGNKPDFVTISDKYEKK